MFQALKVSCLLSSFCEGTLKADRTNSTSLGQQKCHFIKTFNVPVKILSLSEACQKCMIVSNFTRVNPAKKKKNVNVTINSPEGAFNMKPHGTAVAF